MFKPTKFSVLNSYIYLNGFYLLYRINLYTILYTILNTKYLFWRLATSIRKRLLNLPSIFLV